MIVFLVRVLIRPIFSALLTGKKKLGASKKFPVFGAGSMAVMALFLLLANQIGQSCLSVQLNWNRVMRPCDSFNIVSTYTYEVKPFVNIYF